MVNLPRILVVDDDAPILLLMKNLLREFKFEALVATSGAEALRLAQEARPDLLIVDRHMPGMSGDELIGRIRTEIGSSLPVLILSGEPITAEEIGRIGANGAVLKPFELADLIARIRAALAENSVARD